MEITQQLDPRQAEGAGSLSPPQVRLLEAPAAAPSLSCKVISSSAEAEMLRPAWTELVETSARNELTLTPDWLLSWWNVYGRLQGRQLRLASFTRAGRLIGLAPLARRRHWYRGLLPFRRIELLASGERDGHGIFSNHLNVIAARGAEQAVARCLVAELMAGSLGTWDEVVMPMMDGDGPMPYLLADAFRDAGIDVELVEIARAPYISLPPTWEDYLEGLSSTRRRQLTRALRAFDRWSGGEATLERACDPVSLERGKRALIGLHHGRWHERGRSGVFRVPSYVRLHEAMMTHLLKRDALELTWLTVRGEPAVALYAMSWGDTVYAYQMGRRLDVPSNVRLGAVILAHAIRAAIKAGRRQFDLLADESAFKLQLASAVRPLVQVRAVRAGVPESVRRLMQRGLGGVRLLGRVATNALAMLWRRREDESKNPGRK